MHNTTVGIRINGMWKTFRIPGWGETTPKRRFFSGAPATKIDCPQIDGFLSYRECLVFGDFDVLPAGYSSWDEHFSLLQWKYGRMAFFFRSWSGKTKFAIKVRGYRLSRASMIETIRKAFGEDADGIDQNESALRTTFLLPEFFAGIGAFATRQEAMAPVTANTFRLAELPDGFLPEVQGIRRKVMAFVLSFGRRSADGVDCPQKFIADTIGCAPSTVRYTLDEMTLDGTIALVDSTCSFGKKGFTYRVGNVLLAMLAIRTCGSKTLCSPVPLTLEDGAWYSGLWRATNFFLCFDDFLAWAASCGNIHKPGKNRFKMAKKAWLNHCGEEV